MKWLCRVFIPRLANVFARFRISWEAQMAPPNADPTWIAGIHNPLDCCAKVEFKALAKGEFVFALLFFVQRSDLPAVFIFATLVIVNLHRCYLPCSLHSCITSCMSHNWFLWYFEAVDSVNSFKGNWSIDQRTIGGWRTWSTSAKQPISKTKRWKTTSRRLIMEPNGKLQTASPHTWRFEPTALGHCA